MEYATNALLSVTLIYHNKIHSKFFHIKQVELGGQCSPMLFGFKGTLSIVGFKTFLKILMEPPI